MAMLFEKQIVAAYKKNLLVRHDDVGLVHYFSAADFDGLVAEPFSFKGSRGQALCGYVYYYGSISNERLVIFDHGMGAGHRAYMKEIEALARRGFAVLSYDHTGCMRSEGENVGGFAQSLCDLDFCIRAVKADPRLASLSLSVVGHSWGAFSTLNISALHTDITHIVAMSGFVSVRSMLKQFFKGPLGLYIPALYRLECENQPDYAHFDAIESLKISQARALIIHSTDDKTVSFKQHFAKMEKALAARPDTVFLKVEGKGHNPNFTEDAVKIKDAFFADLTKKVKRGYFTDEAKKAEFKASYDFWRMSEQDEALWDKIADFLGK